jgi:hypothetical protein
MAAERVSKAKEDGTESDEAEEDAEDGGGAEGQLVVFAGKDIVVEIAGVAHGVRADSKANSEGVQRKRR